jgi:hypothetical protein
MGLEYRPQGATKFYAPNRDLLHVFTPILKVSLENAVNLYNKGAIGENDPVDDQDVERLHQALAAVRNRALQSDTAEDIIAGFVDAAKGISPELVSSFLEMFAVTVMTHFVYAIRSCVAVPDISDDDLEDCLAASSLLALVPEEQRQAVKRRMLASGHLRRAFAKPTRVQAEAAGREIARLEQAEGGGGANG